MVYSNFVEHGCILFKEFCMQSSGATVQWEEVVVTQSGFAVIDSSDKAKELTQRLPT